MGRLWKLLLLNQFHDVLPGSCISEVSNSSTFPICQFTLTEGNTPRDVYFVFFVDISFWWDNGVLFYSAVPGRERKGLSSQRCELEVFFRFETCAKKKASFKEKRKTNHLDREIKSLFTISRLLMML